MAGDSWTDLRDEVAVWAQMPLPDSMPPGILGRISALLREPLPEDLEEADRLVSGLYGAIPRSTVRLRGAAVEVADRLVTVRRARAQLGGVRDRAALAAGLAQLADRLGSDNYLLRAADVAAEAESVARKLADGADAGARERHAQTLHTLSVALAAVQRHSAALAAVSQAVEIRGSAESSDLLSLAQTRTTRAQRLSDAGRPEEAYADAVAAVSYCRSLNADTAGAAELELSGALRALATAAERLNHQDEALAAVAEAVAVATRLAQARPDAGLMVLLDSLVSEAGCLARARQDSSASARATMTVLRQAAGLDHREPSRVLADGLHLVITALHAGADWGRALELAREGLPVVRRLAASQPEYQSEQVWVLSAAGACLANLNRAAEAVDMFTAAIGVHRGLPAAAARASLHRLASCLNYAGRLSEDAALLEEAADCWQRMVPDLTVEMYLRWVTDLRFLGDFVGSRGEPDEALEWYEQCADLARRMMAGYPTSFGEQLAAVLSRRAVLLSEAGRTDESAEAAEEAAAEYEKLFDADPALFRPGLAQATSTLVRRLFASGRLDEARKVGWKAVRLLRSLARTAPDAGVGGWSAVLRELDMLRLVLDRELGGNVFMAAPVDQEATEDLAQPLAELAAVHREKIAVLRRLAGLAPESGLAEKRTALAGALLDFTRAAHDRADTAVTDGMVRAGLEAVGIYLSLAQVERDGTARYGKSLTDTLRALGAVTAQTADSALRLEARELIVAAYSWLAGADEPQLRNRAFLAAVADGLNQLADALWAAGRQPGAVLTRKRAIDVYTRWSSLETGSQAETAARVRLWSADLAETLARDGRPEEALGPARELLRLDRERGGTESAQPGDQATLAESLSFLAHLLWASGRREEAAGVLGDALAVRRDLLRTAASPTRQARLTAALALRAMWLRALGRPQEASSADDEIRLLDGTNPRCLRERGWALAELAHRLQAFHQRDEALDLLEAAVRAHRQESLAGSAQAPAVAVDELLLAVYRNGDEPGPDRRASLAGEAFALAEQGGGLTLGSAVRLLARRFTAAGEPQEALGLQEVAVEALRRAVAARGAYDPASPDLLLPELAAALSDQSRMLREAGRLPEALAPGLESTAVYRRLADGEQGDDFAEVFIRELTARTRDYADLGDEAAARRTIREAIDWAQASSAVPPSALAAALRRQAFTVARFGHQEEALAILGQAARMYQSAAESAAADWAPPWYGAAVTLCDLAEWNQAAGDQEGYLAAIAQSVTAFAVFMRLAAGAALETAAPITSFAARLPTTGQLTEVLEHAHGSEGQDARLVEMADSLVDIGAGLGQLERLDEAIAVTELGLAVGRFLIGGQILTALPGLAVGQRNLGGYLSRAGRTGDAVTMFVQAVESFGRLCRDSAAEWQLQLAVAQELLADSLWEADRDAEAVAVSREATESRRADIELNGEDVVYLQKLADSEANLADRQWSAEDVDALASTRDQVRTLERIRDLTGGAAAPAAQAVSDALLVLGYRLGGTGDVAGAVAATRRAIELSTEISAELGEDEAAASSRAAPLMLNLGVYLGRAGHDEEALRASAQAVRGFLALASAADEMHGPGPGRVLQERVVLALSNLADLLSEAGRYAEAVTATRGALDKNLRLRGDYPELAEIWATERRLNLRLSRRLVKLDSPEQALDAVNEAIAAHARFVALDGKGDEAYESDWAELEEQLALCLAAAGGSAQDGGDDE